MMKTPTEIAKEVISTERLVAIELKRIITQYADPLSEEAAKMLEQLTEMPLARAQINGLLAVVNTSRSVAPVKQFLERQGARQKSWQQDNLAERLISEIKVLGEMAKEVAQEAQLALRERHRRTGSVVDALTEPKRRLSEVHYLLVREFVQAFGIGYLYRGKLRGGDVEREEER